VNEKRNFLCLEFHITREQDTLPMHCSANVGDKDDTMHFLWFMEPENNFISRSKRKLIGDDEHGWTSENTVLILKADATLR
jgi:phosphoenolpyruvate carboxykinase (ATP)